MGFLNDIGLNLEILTDEIGRISGIGNNSADLGRCEEYIFGSLGGEKLPDCNRVGQIQF
jgi:hypothetical protein